ncbi:bis(5'-nucleosyl)-tetraphosphatase (symmetrical) YqeK [Clostridium aestuarii]|uniref:bis(5'-nucleosyl)-tetraphosphatase (symmetrical) n=1 Tax=Clostridium aestuarii TaxID=338193 RepID=A0ABT4CZ61_9CLOT|nr:bis(5'-nucleosyl)-tetraphosphatase (symmetrical) YqeK [Clostridium aestuarii]MCY6484276.1 bis(5'-nucleosyl)-tetraphosphatase (symmetrical) YqeK [Clostridium aestuarii]
MWSEKKIIEYLKRNLKDKRFKHSLSVRDTAVKLAEIYGANVEKAKIAGLVHDCGKYVKNDEMLNIAEKYGYNINEVCLGNSNILHGVVGAYIAKNTMGIEDNEVLDAVVYHTTARRNMTLLDKIIYIADYIEPLRSFPGVERVRKVTYENLNEGLIMCFDNTIKYVVDKGELLHNDTIEARNYMLYSLKWRKDE